MKFGYLNYGNDPNNKGRKMFVYLKQVEAEDMLQRTQGAGIDAHIEHREKTGVWLVSIPKTQFDKAFDCNAQVKAASKSYLIADRPLRFFLLGIFFLALSIALTGAIVTAIKG
jgi:hypothetical protein